MRTMEGLRGEELEQASKRAGGHGNEWIGAGRPFECKRVFCQLFLAFEKTFLDPAPNRAEAGHSQPPNHENEKRLLAFIFGPCRFNWPQSWPVVNYSG